MTTAAPPRVPPIFSFPFLLDPWPTLTWLRENDPLHHVPGAGLIVLTRAADCAAALAHSGLSADGGQAERTETSGAPISMLNTDGAQHVRLRKPGGVLLGPGAVARALPRIGADIDAALDALAPARARPGEPSGGTGSPGASADLIRDVAEPVATLALAGLLAIDPDAVAEFDHHARSVAIALDPVPSPAVATRAQEAMAAFHVFAAGLIDRAAPDSPLGRLVRSGGIDHGEALGVVSLAVVGGWRPLADLVAVALHGILTDDELRRAASDPDWLAGWCEDVTRWHTPIPFVARKADRAVSLPSGVIPAGSQVLVHCAAANHDPAAHGAPESVVPARPEGHLAYGAGSHLCLGAPLVRATLPLVVASLLRCYPDACLGAPRLTWRPQAFPRSPMSSAVHLHGRAATLPAAAPDHTRERAS